MSSDPFALVFGVDVDLAEAERLLLVEGGVLLDPSRREWVVSHGETHVWVFLRSQEHLEPEDESTILAALGSPPRTMFTMEVLRNQGAEITAMKLVCIFSQVWPCVLFDYAGRVYTPAHLESLLRAGQGLDAGTE